MVDTIAGMPKTQAPTRGYTATKDQLLARLRRIEGQIRGIQGMVEDELRVLLGIPEQVALSATITLGRPEGHHGAVRRRPLPELVYEEEWGRAASFAVDPPGTRHTAAGPPRT